MQFNVREARVGNIVAENPCRSAVFERHGIDYCCGGNRSLQDACEEAGVDLGAITREIESVDRREAERVDTWLDRSLTDLVDHIEGTHHAYVRTALPRLVLLSEKVGTTHGARDPRYCEILRVIYTIAEDLQSHMLEEEQILFPLIRDLDSDTDHFRVHCDSVANSIATLETDHLVSGNLLQVLRGLTDDYQPAPDACNTTRSLYAALVDFETNMHAHVHKERCILFPRSLARERALDEIKQVQ